ncbi:MAG: dipeptide epimerase [Candidatus Eremiobacteraeota bacterium]|nr:dipeptide epimerase [Candidatus Eremiobacteraeota bacterium]
MKSTRRDFIRTAAFTAGLCLAGGGGPARIVWAGSKVTVPGPAGAMKLSFRPYTIELKHAFVLSTSARTSTPVMLTEIEYEGHVGYGEASMPPYLGESHQSVAEFLRKVDLRQFKDPFELEDILSRVDELAPRNTAAKASVDIALHDLVGKLMGQPFYRIWGYSALHAPYTSFTIGIDTPEVVRQKTREASQFKILKVKLGRDTDRQMIETIRSVTPVPLCADVNQGWKDRNVALEMCRWLKEKNCVFVEQPMPKEQVEDLAWLTERSPLPIIGDEGVQRLPDVYKAKGVYSGINIKLMKSTGMREARKMLDAARAMGLKVMLGCMTETSCAISAASQLSPAVDWADLDGALLISNDPFKGTAIKDGRVVLQDLPGIGVTETGAAALKR